MYTNTDIGKISACMDSTEQSSAVLKIVDFQTLFRFLCVFNVSMQLNIPIIKSNEGAMLRRWILHSCLKHIIAI